MGSLLDISPQAISNELRIIGMHVIFREIMNSNCTILSLSLIIFDIFTIDNYIKLKIEWMSKENCANLRSV